MKIFCHFRYIIISFRFHALDLMKSMIIDDFACSLYSWYSWKVRIADEYVLEKRLDNRDLSVDQWKSVNYSEITRVKVSTFDTFQHLPRIAALPIDDRASTSLSNSASARDAARKLRSVYPRSAAPYLPRDTIARSRFRAKSPRLFPSSSFPSL